jgi:hypothetical protein
MKNSENFSAKMAIPKSRHLVDEKAKESDALSADGCVGRVDGRRDDVTEDGVVAKDVLYHRSCQPALVVRAR